jgi:hypothetical protein
MTASTVLISNYNWLTQSYRNRCMPIFDTASAGLISNYNSRTESRRNRCMTFF